MWDYESVPGPVETELRFSQNLNKKTDLKRARTGIFTFKLQFIPKSFQSLSHFLDLPQWIFIQLLTGTPEW